MLLYHTLSGEFVNGWHVEEGHRYSTCEPVTEEDSELLSRSGTNCYIEQVTTYYVDCQDYAGYNYTFYEDELYIYPWSYSTCGTPYPVIEYYQVCDDDTEDDSGSSGGGITGGGGSSTSGGGSAPLAKAMFRNSNMIDQNWGIIERMLEKITEDCMGRNLYNALLDKLDGKQLIIQFVSTGNSRFEKIGEGYGITLNMEMESNQLFHEMMHAYRSYKETLNSYNESMINGEMEAWYAQYLYVKKLPEYDGSKWETKYNSDNADQRPPLRPAGDPGTACKASFSVKQIERPLEEEGEHLRAKASQDECGAGCFDSPGKDRKEQKKGGQNFYPLLQDLHRGVFPHPSHGYEIAAEDRGESDEWEGDRKQTQGAYRPQILEPECTDGTCERKEEGRCKTAEGERIENGTPESGGYPPGLLPADGIDHHARDSQMNPGGRKRQGKAVDAGEQRKESHRFGTHARGQIDLKGDVDASHQKRHPRHQ